MTYRDGYAHVIHFLQCHAIFTTKYIEFMLMCELAIHLAAVFPMSLALGAFVLFELFKQTFGLLNLFFIGQVSHYEIHDLLL